MAIQQPMAYDEFCRLAQQGNVVPVCASVLADTVTPVAAFLKIASGRDDAFLLESVQGGENLARFSFLGVNPKLKIEYRRPKLHVEQNGETVESEQDIFTYLQQSQKELRNVVVKGMPRFTGGFVGYFGYDTIRDLEHIPSRGARENASALPDAGFRLYDTILAFDHLKQQILLIANVFIREGELNLRRRYEEACERIEQLKAALSAPPPSPPERPAGQLAEPVYESKRDDFIAAVKRVKEYIRAGDTFQTVLSQRFRSKITVDPFQIYRALRIINPSPYLYFLKTGEASIIGSSPEVLVRVEDGVAQVRPIAGTRRRSSQQAEDLALEQELLSDAKERAEHLMLVDLGRNDLGRVCKYGSVKVDELMVVERYSHVMHLVSNVQGELAGSRDAIDALRACFPAGTVSGAPKIRAMEIIDELEPIKRGPYAGAVGYLDFSGNLDTCITIRTIWTQGDQAYFQAGAGIVADSDPAKEYIETIEKSRALWNAIDLAERGLA